jgi:hypothetical protein
VVPPLVVDAQYWPAGQLVQAVAPVLVLNVPAAQAVGADMPAFGQASPAGQLMQAELEVLPMLGL